MARHPPSRCPGKCRAANPAQSPASERLRHSGVIEDWTTDATRCVYCGCVYTGWGKSTMIRGWLDGIDQGWVPKP
jgi:hypothetical protein